MQNHSSRELTPGAFWCVGKNRRSIEKPVGRCYFFISCLKRPAFAIGKTKDSVNKGGGRKMRFQKDSCSCGPTAALNALECIGITNISGRTMACRCGTDERGETDENGIVSGLEASGFKTEIMAHIGKSNAFAALHAALNDGCPVILSVDHCKHWVVAIGKLNERVTVFDSTRTKVNLRKSGVQHLTKRQLFNRWHWDEKERYYGIIVRKPACY